MAMDLRDPNVWISHLLENLPEEKLASALKDDNPNWEYIDGEIVKLGSLAHSQLDIPELQRRGLVILASESKDFRLLAHLLRTLQHAGDPHLALRLLALYVEHYWAVAAPQNMAHKKRFASQVIKRFETGIEGFSQNAATEQRDALSGELAKLAQCWQSHNAPELAQATDDLFALYQRAFNRAAPAPVPTPAASGSSPQTTATSESGVTQPSAPAPQIVIDSHDDKAWRDTLLKVAAILCERQPDSPQGYQQLTELHRYLLAIQNAPVPGKSALKAVQLRLDQNSSDPIFATRQMAKTLPAPLNRWVGRLTDQAWHVVMVEAVHYMEVDWRDSVVKPFNEQLANNYPFNPRSAQDASLDAFERFFKPDGILDTFYQQNLKLFIDNDLSLEDGDNNVIIREDIIAQLETAQKIRDIFFSKQNGLGTSFAVETVSLSGNKRRSVLNLDGQLVDYSQGRNYTAHLVWPNNMREGNESKLTLIGTSGNAPRSISFSGPWAQFRLFGAGQLTGVQDGNFTVRFSVDGGAMTYRVHTDTEDNPFSGGLFSQFGLSDTLY